MPVNLNKSEVNLLVQVVRAARAKARFRCLRYKDKGSCDRAEEIDELYLKMIKSLRK